MMASDAIAVVRYTCLLFSPLRNCNLSNILDIWQQCDGPSGLDNPGNGCDIGFWRTECSHNGIFEDALCRCEKRSFSSAAVTSEHKHIDASDFTHLSGKQLLSCLVSNLTHTCHNIGKEKVGKDDVFKQSEANKKTFILSCNLSQEIMSKMCFSPDSYNFFEWNKISVITKHFFRICNIF